MLMIKQYITILYKYIALYNYVLYNYMLMIKHTPSFARKKHSLNVREVGESLKIFLRRLLARVHICLPWMALVHR